jgi:hypothetical protein
MTLGKSRLAHPPSWFIGASKLALVDSLLYLGALLADDKGVSHSERRIGAAQRAFHGLQGAGLHFGGLDPPVAGKLYCTGVRSTLLYGCEAMHIKNTLLKKIETTQGKMIKSFLGLPHSSRNTPLFSALSIPSTRLSIALSSLNLLRSCLLYPSLASHFYLYLLSGSSFCSNTLVNRCSIFAQEFDFNFMKCLFFKCKSKSLECPADGVADSLKFLFLNYNSCAKELCKQLLCPF